MEVHERKKVAGGVSPKRGGRERRYKLQGYNTYRVIQKKKKTGISSGYTSRHCVPTTFNRLYNVSHDTFFSLAVFPSLSWVKKKREIDGIILISLVVRVLCSFPPKNLKS